MKMRKYGYHKLRGFWLCWKSSEFALIILWGVVLWRRGVFSTWRHVIYVFNDRCRIILFKHKIIIRRGRRRLLNHYKLHNFFWLWHQFILKQVLWWSSKHLLLLLLYSVYLCSHVYQWECVFAYFWVRIDRLSIGNRGVIEERHLILSIFSTFYLLHLQHFYFLSFWRE